jgi:hypothetical protein
VEARSGVGQATEFEDYLAERGEHGPSASDR